MINIMMMMINITNCNNKLMKNVIMKLIKIKFNYKLMKNVMMMLFNKLNN